MTSFPYSRDCDPPAPFANIAVSWRGKSVKMTAFIDSGADSTMIPLATLQAINALLVEQRMLRGVTGYRREVNIYGVHVEIADLPAIPVSVVAIEDGDEPILGRDVLNHLIITLDGIGGVTEIR